ncbi:DUF2177 family protein [Altererythrobacter confluentis]|uniref:DUF2177 family protein n=1 Tax=Allopontixanthobacter confluentis TaxID=1849021 RepID=A0A6L7GET7_9SPHN|nr:DUF2177 family protein [Allopontixanthobacter confluentis]MXP13986.1 DUF2177 family protein [Allopontixanthobacter confluentis]
MKWIIAYIAMALPFGLLDALWLRWAGPNFYRPHLGELLAENFRAGPAVVFYLIYVAGVVWFAIRPGLAAGIPGGLGIAALNGALLGGLCYATYDLTNQATMKVWSTQVTVADILWGAFATATAATIATWVTQKVV